MNKQELLLELKRVASELKRSPTRDEFSKSTIGADYHTRKLFGSFGALLKEAGLDKKKGPNLNTDFGFKFAQQNAELKSLRQEVSEIQEDVLSAQMVRRIVGTEGLDTLGQDSDWLKGSKFKRSEGINGIPTLFLSDWHLDEVVKKEQVRGMNEYNRAIAEKRLEFTFIQAVRLLKKSLVAPRYEGIICPFGGDFVSGTIHDELAETNEEAINKTILFWADKLVGGLTLLADEFGKVFVPCVVGNHGRHHKKPRHKDYVIDNFEWIMYQIIARAVKSDSRISMMIPESTDAFFSVYGRRICLTHGNQFKGGEGIGGIMVPILRGLSKKQNREAAVDNSFYLTMMGHWHQYIHTRSLLINGSGKGYDEYAFNSNFSFEDPAQALFINHRDRGVVFPMSIICSAYEKNKTNKAQSIIWD